jgi:hypothetical protein
VNFCPPPAWPSNIRARRRHRCHAERTRATPYHLVLVTSYAIPMTQLSKLQLDAAGPFTDLVANTLSGEGRAVQTETAVASISRLAGSLLLRSFKFDLLKSAPVP